LPMCWSKTWAMLPLVAKRVDVEYADLLGRPRRCTAPARNCSRCSHCRASSGTRLSASARCAAPDSQVSWPSATRRTPPPIFEVFTVSAPDELHHCRPAEPGDRDAVYRLVPTDSIHRPDRVDRPTCDQTPGAPLCQISSTRAGPAIKNDAERDRGFASAHRSGSSALPQPGTRRGDRGNPRRIPSCGVCGGLLRGCASWTPCCGRSSHSEESTHTRKTGNSAAIRSNSSSEACRSTGRCGRAPGARARYRRRIGARA
jgi:hypothetical protein